MDTQNYFQKKDRNRGLVAFLVVAVSIFLITWVISTVVDIQKKVKESTSSVQEIKSKNHITVSEEGEVYATPDLAIAVFSVVNEATTVDKALVKNTERVNKVIEEVKKQGVADKDVKTSHFSMYPRYEYFETTGKRILAGYEITNSLEVKIREMQKIGQIMETATNAGANQVGDLQFTIDQPDELKAKARGEAIKKAKDKAKAIASQLGVELVRVTNFNESSEMPHVAKYEMVMAESAMGKGEAAAPEIMTGENKISVRVNITYEIE